MFPDPPEVFNYTLRITPAGFFPLRSTSSPSSTTVPTLLAMCAVPQSPLGRVVASPIFFPLGTALSFCSKLVLKLFFTTRVQSLLICFPGHWSPGGVSLPHARPGVVHAILLLHHRSASSIPAPFMLCFASLRPPSPVAWYRFSDQYIRWWRSSPVQQLKPQHDTATSLTNLYLQSRCGQDFPEGNGFIDIDRIGYR